MSVEDSGSGIMAQIRKAILEDTKMMGRRLSVDEAKIRYGSYGIEATEVIAAMVDEGLIRRSTGPAAGQKPEAAEDEHGYQPWSSAGTGQRAQSFDSEAFSREMSSIVTGIVGEIERGVSRGMVEARRAAARYESEQEAAERANASRHDDGRQSAGTGGAESKADASCQEEEEGAERQRRDRKRSRQGRGQARHNAGSMEEYRGQLADRVKKAWGGFASGISSFAVAGVLVYFFMPRWFQYRGWWLMLPAVWAMSIIGSFVKGISAGAQRREAEGLPELDQEALEAYRKLGKDRDELEKSISNLFTFPLLFAAVGALISSQFNAAVFLIPSALIAAASIGRIASYFASRGASRKRVLRLAGTDSDWGAFIKSGLPGRNSRRQGNAGLDAGDKEAKGPESQCAEYGAYAGRIREAEDLVSALRAAFAGDAQLAAEMEPELSSYLEQLKALARATAEIGRAVGEIPMAELEKDKKQLMDRAASGEGSGAAVSEALKREYAASISEIEKQEKSYAALREQGEVLALRLSSGVNQLRRMRIDAERLKTGGARGLAGLDELKAKSEELSQSIEDLRKGYEEL